MNGFRCFAGKVSKNHTKSCWVLKCDIRKFFTTIAGHSAQNILLEATRHNVATLEIGGFVDNLLSEAIDLSPDYHPLILVAFGKEGKSPNVSSATSIEVDWAIPVSQNYNPDFAIASARLSNVKTWSHGRDLSPEIALKKAISETREWTSCGCIPKLTNASYVELKNVIDPREIIQFHSNQYQIKGFPFGQFDENIKHEWIKGFDVDGEGFYILADNVYFPYYPETPYHCYANSSGCAAYPDEQIAIEKGTLELVERDSFMNAYFSKLDMPIVSNITLPDSIQKRIKKLQDAGFKIWIVDHSLDLAPVVFVFAQNLELTFTTCASCSSFDIEEATGHALMEVEASVLYRLQHGLSGKIKPDEIMWPNDHGKLYGQEEYFQRADFLVGSNESISFNEIGNNCSKDWNSLLGCFKDKGWKHLVIPLTLTDDYGGNDDLHIVRIIVPGTVQMTFGYQQEPAGMKRIYEIAKRYKGRNISFEELTKFPHPFE
jgi:ribosomal protein S12 methylthiotransferase accessory factor